MSVELLLFFVEQTLILLAKNFRQLQRRGRNTLSQTFIVPLIWLAFVGMFFQLAIQQENSPEIYDLHALPPLDKTSRWGVFNPKAPAPANRPTGQAANTLLIFSPDNHDGVNSVMQQLKKKYPDIETVGVADTNAINDKYYTNLFKTWAAIEFDLTPDQKATGKFKSTGMFTSDVAYKLRMSPLVASKGLFFPTEKLDVDVYNERLVQADLFWNTGYLTLQNFVRTTIAEQFNVTDR